MFKVYMEMLLYLVLGCTFVVVLLSTIYKKTIKLPSPPSIPLLGHLHLLGSLPHQSLHKLSQHHGDLMFLKLGSVNTLVVSSARAAREVLKTHDLVFASRPPLTTTREFAYQGLDLGFAPYGEHWKSVRKFCTLELFTSKQVDLLHPLRALEVGAMYCNISEAAKSREEVNLTMGLKVLTFNIMSRMVLSKSFSGTTQDKNNEALIFVNAFVESLALMGRVFIGDVLPFFSWLDFFVVRRMRAVHKIQDDFLQKELDQHRHTLLNSPNEFTKDLIYDMLSLGTFDDTTIKAIAQDVLVAGADTTAGTVDWAMSELIKNPDMMMKAQQELQQITGRTRAVEVADVPKLFYLQAVVNETLRLHPIAPLLLPHESTGSCTIDGVFVPANTRLIVNAYAIARDPGQWNEPEKFDPERFVDSPVDVRGKHYQVIPFGSGRRMCPGMHLGLTSAQFILASLLNDFDWEYPGGGERLDMSEAFGLVINRAVPLKLVPVKVR